MKRNKKYSDSKKERVDVGIGRKTACIEMTRSHSAYVVVDGVRYSIAEEDLMNALCFDEVIVDLLEDNRARVLKIKERKINELACEVRKEKVKGKNCLYLETLGLGKERMVKVSKSDMANLVEGQRVLVKLANDIEDSCMVGRVMRTIGHRDDPENDLVCIAMNHGFDVSHTKQSEKELSLLKSVITEEEIQQRVDLRDKLIFTIDGKSAMDLDDAISLERLPNGNYQLGVHIAHVSHYVKWGSSLYQDALSRGTSLYMLNTVIPMFDHVISNGICSLNPDADKLTRTVEIEIDQEGNVVSYRIYKSVIRSKKKMCYDDVNTILEKNRMVTGYEEFVSVLREMDGLSKLLTRKRLDSGYINFDDSEVKFRLNPSTGKKEPVVEVQNSAMKLIENFMLMANFVVIEYLYHYQIPTIYRNHEAPDVLKMEELLDLMALNGYDTDLENLKRLKSKLDMVRYIDNPRVIQRRLQALEQYDNFPILSSLLLKGMTKAYYSSYNQGHYALGGAEFYTHFTSPIRRGADLVIHSLLDFVDDYENNLDIFAWFDCHLEEICEHISYKERQAVQAEREARKFAMVQYMKEHLHEEFIGYVSDVHSRYIAVRTEDMIDGVAYVDRLRYHFDYKSRSLYDKAGNTIRIGDKFLMKAISVDSGRRQVEFSLEEKLALSHKIRKLTDLDGK